MACIMGSGSKGISPTSSSNISSNSRQLRWLAARQVRFTRASSSVADVTKNLSLSSSTLPFRTSPWLMLPPKDLMFNRFYTLEEKIVIPINKHMTTRTTTTSDHEMMDDEPLCIGSSHGWLAYINRSDCALFLYNPISHRIIKLPSIDTLPLNQPFHRYLFIKKLILSSPPNDEDNEEEGNRCIAMCIFGYGQDLCFCRPGHDISWIPLEENISYYEDIAYSSNEQLFYSLNRNDEVESWDLRDPLSPKRKVVADLQKEEVDHWTPLPAEYRDESREEYWSHRHELWSKYMCFKKSYLIAEPWSSSDDFLLIERFVAKQIREDGSLFSDYLKQPDILPYKTLFFEVYKVDIKNKVTKFLKHSLNHRVLFVGMNQSFSLPARDFPHLRPNSIYFTDDLHTKHALDDTKSYGGHDMGIFNYENKRFASCYYPCDLKSIKRIMPPPVWLTPNPPLA